MCIYIYICICTYICLQRIALRSSTPQRAAARCSVLQCVAVCCRALQCVAVCCSVLQCVAVCCSVLQCVAVCCGVLCRESDVITSDYEEIEECPGIRIKEFDIVHKFLILLLSGLLRMFA